MTLELLDTSLRDGMHCVGNSFTPAQVGEVSAALDRAGVGFIEVAHAAGLGGSSIQFGLAAATDVEYIRAAVGAVEKSKIVVLLLPGIGTIKLLSEAHAAGAQVVRIATHSNEADLAAQHISWARENGIFTVGFLMMSHLLGPRELADQAALMESYGAQVVYVVDSAGAMIPAESRDRVEALRQRLDVDIGFHAHNNLGCAIGNSLAAVDAGATWIDGSIRGLGAGAGNAQTEVLAATLLRAGHSLGIDLIRLLDAADIATPLLPSPQIIDGTTIMLGFAGVYSTFLEDAERAAQDHGVDPREILLEAGRQGVRGGEEHLIAGIAAALSAARSPASDSSRRALVSEESRP